MKRLILCADDYAMAPGVSAAIRDLAAQKRLNATSVMAPGPHLKAEAEALKAVRPEGFRTGLHLTLTGGLKPLTGLFGGRFLPLPALMARAFAGALDKAALAREIEAQVMVFQEAFGHAPDFFDGHQHCHVLPRVRPLVLAAARRHAPKAFIRQCRGPYGAGTGIKGQVIAALSASLAGEASRAGLATNPAFSGAYPMREDDDYAAYFPRFLKGLPDHALVMCHPGQVDEALKAVDPVHGARETEYAFFRSPRFDEALAQAGFRLDFGD